ncbi:integrin alpha-L-like [Colossoma macropomum]|uniref:integrin alpha-L-like n=1 Tax=Colossoma macropomum TaxID=42526 RepID=UPI001864F335|nr:integrin alpha-L-like [Colossoma macropomum]XP_036420535.1 integrin alpha-L-like [Colossoma macropomum]
MVNLVFLFDGSSSMMPKDFAVNKRLIWNIMTQLKNSSIKFAAVQFSAVPRTVFTFNDYMDGTAKKKLDEEEHMKDLTHTHQAIDYVLVNLFNSISSGVDPEATKVLVIITDGVPTDFNTKDVIKRCEDQQITRFVIGVGNVDINKLRRFASEPKDKNTFQIEDYSGLEGLSHSLQTKIDNIEESPKTMVNLVFLFDGSSSMKTQDFYMNKMLIWNIMTRLKKLSIKFAAVQFSGVPRTVFTFNDYMDGTAKKKLDEEEHMKDLTHTHQAIDYVLVNLFNSISSGADPEATKVLVIITDGVPTDFNTKDVIKRCEDQQITRFVIGVGNIDINKLRRFASEPKDKNTFQIEDYSGLEGLSHSLQTKIYNIEGAQAASPHSSYFDDTRFFGMSMAVRSTPLSGLTSCSPSFAPDCEGNLFLINTCYHFSSQLELIAKDKVTFQECSKTMVNLVFLIDGSSSMKTSAFNKNKKFIWNIMTRLKHSSIQFAAVQFSGVPRIVFDFNDYMDGTAKKKLDEEEHMKDLTNTHQAIDYVLVNLFNSVSSGAEPEATKALVIITDGTPTDFNTKDVIKRCDDQQITRFVIGVGNVDIRKLRRFASEPKDKNTFQIEDYSGLEGLSHSLQTKIYNIEGAQSAFRKKWTKELSHSGFSTAYDKDVLVLGAAESNEWSGMLYEDMRSGDGTREIKDPKLKNESYMGYSVAVGEKDGISLLFSGTPRFNHSGQVTLFNKHEKTWEVTTHVSGEQVGSYFGASLCLLDMDSDGDTDFVVVGAPLYYQAQPQREGRMYVYKLTNEMKLVKELEVADCVQGQFAATVTSVADLNGDELQDVAVGAPLENNGRGAVYIYLGNRTQGIRPQYSQRILAQMISEQLQQFGVAIDGVMDMEGDGLTDIVVGARGTVMLLKAQPVLSVSANLSFSPSEISLDNFDCLVKTENTIPVATLSICFGVKEDTHSTGVVRRGLNVSFELSADSVKQWSRAFFQPTNNQSRNLLNSVLLDSHCSCFNQTLYMEKCVKDTSSPVLIQLNFSQAEQQPSSSNAVLNIDSRTEAYVEVPFQRK